MHLLSSLFNDIRRSSRILGQLYYLDVEKALEAEQPIGVVNIHDLSWKHLLDTYTCTECGRCEAECPASRTGKPLSPKKLILDLRHHLLEVGPALARRRDGDDQAADVPIATTAAHEETRETARLALVG